MEAGKPFGWDVRLLSTLVGWFVSSNAYGDPFVPIEDPDVRNQGGTRIFE